MTFINKMDMPGRDPLDLMNEVKKNVLQIHSYAMNWPIGSGKEFQGVVDRAREECIFFTKVSHGGAQKAEMARIALKSEEAKNKIGEEAYKQLCEELDLLKLAGNPFSQEAFLAGEVTPVFFASALTNFGVEPFFDALSSPMPACADSGKERWNRN